nr:BrnA antitoxin family protein [uncultured Rhodopila sp.]
MISDEPDEDADSLDDDALVEAYTGTIITPEPTAAAIPPPADWPYSASQQDTLAVDADILAWFQANHPDWRRRVSAVLRAWIAAQPAKGLSPSASAARD